MRRFVLIVLFVAGCAGLCSLGLWQLSRADDKRVRFAAFEARSAAVPVDIATLTGSTPLAEMQWRRARVSGHYLTRHLVLDNRVQAGSTGYEVLSAFASTSGRVVLVDRGWIPLGKDRNAIPDTLAPADMLMLEGVLGDAPIGGLMLGDAAQSAELLAPDVYRVQQISIPAAESLLGVKLWPAILYLDAQAGGALKVAWPVPGDGASKHTAYAVQWFAMAAVLAAIGLRTAHRHRVIHDA